MGMRLSYNTQMIQTKPHHIVNFNLMPLGIFMFESNIIPIVNLTILTISLWLNKYIGIFGYLICT